MNRNKVMVFCRLTHAKKVFDILYLTQNITNDVCNFVQLHPFVLDDGAVFEKDVDNGVSISIAFRHRCNWRIVFCFTTGWWANFTPIQIVRINCIYKRDEIRIWTQMISSETNYTYRKYFGFVSNPFHRTVGRVHLKSRFEI